MSEIQMLLSKNYEECCDYFKNKYGIITKNYFYNETCRTINNSIKKSKEGLFIHHIDEDKYENLSNKDEALKAPFECQKGDRLVYCNLLEHFLLHIKILEKNFNKYPNIEHYTPVTMLFILPDLNDVYRDIEYVQEYRQAMAKVIKNNKNDYLLCLELFIELFHKITLNLINSKNKRKLKPFYLEIKNGIGSKNFKSTNLFNKKPNVPKSDDLLKEIESIYELVSQKYISKWK